MDESGPVSSVRSVDSRRRAATSSRIHHGTLPMLPAAWANVTNRRVSRCVLCVLQDLFVLRNEIVHLRYGLSQRNDAAVGLSNNGFNYFCCWRGLGSRCTRRGHEFAKAES